MFLPPFLPRLAFIFLRDLDCGPAVTTMGGKGEMNMAITKEKALARIQAHVPRLGLAVGMSLAAVLTREDAEDGYLVSGLADDLDHALSRIERDLVQKVAFLNADISEDAKMVASLREAHGSLFAYFKN